MNKTLLLYSGSFLFIAVGLLSIWEGLRKKSMKSIMLKANYTPPRNYGKPFLVVFGVLCIILGIALLNK